MVFLCVLSLRSAKVAVRGLLFKCLFGTIISMATASTPELEEMSHSFKRHCPLNCSCSAAGDGGVNVTCHDGTPSDIINNLPDNTVHFRYTYDSLFNDSGCQFRHMPTFQTITITATDLYSYSAPHSHLQNGDLFRGAINLRELHINLLLFELNSKVLKSLTKLEILDLSHTRSLTRENMEEILRGTVLFHPRLKKLHIRNFYYLIPVEDKILDVSNNIYNHLNGSQIEELDISLNGVIFNTPGISQYLPDLKTLVSTNNEIGFSETFGYFCSIADTLLHPSLERIEFGHQPPDYRRTRPNRSLHHRNPLDELIHCFQSINMSEPCSPDMRCDVGRCLCKGHDAIPTQYIPELGEWFSFLHPRDMRIPLQKQKHVDLSHTMRLFTPRIATHVTKQDSFTLSFNRSNLLVHRHIRQPDVLAAPCQRFRSSAPPGFPK